jgi:hypothetical protein
MLQLVGSWFVERDPDYTRATNVLDKARKNLAASPSGIYVRGLSESLMDAEQLRDHTRPPALDIPQGMSRREHVCAQWLARWLAAWEPKDEKSRNQVIDQTRARVTA